MKICVAQTRPIAGDIQQNIEKHRHLIALAATNGADGIIFPELSLTGYEPSLAKELAAHPEDGRFHLFQSLSDNHHITIGVGMPTKHEAGLCISMILFQPGKARQVYCKKYLHADERPFFVSGPNLPPLPIKEINVGLAVCYELSIPAHAALACKNGAHLYAASVAKSVKGVTNAAKRLSTIAKTYSMPVLMSNCVGPAEDFVSAGKTAVWNQNGRLVAQLGATEEGILIYDTQTHKPMKKRG